MKYAQMNRAQLEAEKKAVSERFEALKGRGLKLDMSRGKPCTEQLDLSLPMQDVLTSDSDYRAENGLDVRNYGGLDGIPEAKRLFAELMEVSDSEVLVYGNSSLNLMYDTLMRGMLFGIREGTKPYNEEPNRKWLCPVPGYDRHFAVTQQLGFELISVPMNADGPDMDLVEKLVREDASVKGIWCVPTYSNPGGVVYSEQTIRRLAALKPAADNFAVMYDNAYLVHPLYGEFIRRPCLLEAAKAAGNPDMVFTFVSTSKCSFAGAGVAAMAASESALAHHHRLLAVQTIGFDKVNQLRHVRYFKNADGIRAHMQKHAAILRPKFDSVLKMLDEELAPIGVGSWSRPQGGYFISFDAPEGCAKRVVALCKEAGLVLTGAGAAFPYGRDPKDSNIRIAPSYPKPAELETASQLFCTAVRLAALEKLLEA